MGLKPKEVKELTLKDFNLMLTGYQRREEREWNRTRHIMAFVFNFSGFGSKTPVKPEALWPLMIDREDEKRMITTMAQAMAMLQEFNGKAGI